MPRRALPRRIRPATNGGAFLAPLYVAVGGQRITGDVEHAVARAIGDADVSVLPRDALQPGHAVHLTPFPNFLSVRVDQRDVEQRPSKCFRDGIHVKRPVRSQFDLDWILRGGGERKRIGVEADGDGTIIKEERGSRLQGGHVGYLGCRASVALVVGWLVVVVASR